MESVSAIRNRISRTRGGTIALGIAAAVLAGIVLLVYLNSYRNSVNSSAEPTGVLVAKNLIPKGTSGTIVAEQEFFQVTQLPKDELKVGAIADPAYLAGRVATADIFPGQQLTTAEFSTAASSALTTKISGKQRAVALPVSGARGLVGYVSNGDHVDIYYETGASGGTILGLLASDVLVLSAPQGSAEGSTGDANVVLRATPALAQTFALAQDTGTLWYILRPPAAASATPPRTITSQQLLQLITSQVKR